MALYLLDANFFIQTYRVNYPLDVAVSFWAKVKQLANEGKIFSIDKVKNEIYGSNDALENWCKENLPEDFFRDSTQVVPSYQEVVEWVISKNDHYTAAAISEFLDTEEADAFIVAYALANRENRIIVTHEVSEPHRKNKVKIPDVCYALDIRFTDTMGMFRALGEGI